MTGSSELDAEQRDYYAHRFGVRYLRVQEQPLRPSRRVRRGRPRDESDLRVFEIQRDAERALRKALIVPVPKREVRA